MVLLSNTTVRVESYVLLRVVGLACRAALVLVEVVGCRCKLGPPAHVCVHVVLLQRLAVGASTSIAEPLLPYGFTVKVLGPVVKEAWVLSHKAVSLLHSLVLQRAYNRLVTQVPLGCRRSAASCRLVHAVLLAEVLESLTKFTPELRPVDSAGLRLFN